MISGNATHQAAVLAVMAAGADSALTLDQLEATLPIEVADEPFVIHRTQADPRLLDLALLLAVGATVVTTVPAVGTILSVALLSVPALTARLVTERVGRAMLVGAAYGAASGVLGLTASAEWDYAAGACITLASAVLFFATFAVVSASRRGSRRRALRVAASA